VVVLETPRLLLRHLQPDDLSALARLYADPEIRRHFPDGTRTVEETRQELEYFLHGHPRHPHLGLWATIEKDTGAFVGRCGLLPWEIDGKFEVELACLIDKLRWREGFASEAGIGIIAHAQNTLHLQRLICVITPGNTASIRTATKVGMRFEREYTDEYGLCHIYSRALGREGAP
jgi:ribosomal-protein-alanine N-acetyltransferase